jgi:hypothetical protein
MAIKIKVTGARLAFAQLFTPKIWTSENGTPGKPRYECVLLFKPKDPQVEMIWETIKQVANDQWGKDGPATLTSILRNKKCCFFEGDDKAEQQGFAGHMALTTHSKTRPMVVDSDKRTPLVERDGRPYSGCFVHASVDIWAQDNGFGKRINSGLVAVMFSRDGEPFGGGSVAEEDEFDSVEEEDPIA